MVQAQIDDQHDFYTAHPQKLIGANIVGEVKPLPVMAAIDTDAGPLMATPVLIQLPAKTPEKANADGLHICIPACIQQSQVKLLASGTSLYLAPSLAIVAIWG